MVDDDVRVVVGSTLRVDTDGVRPEKEVRTAGVSELLLGVLWLRDGVWVAGVE